jgi:hypothetical protein
MRSCDVCGGGTSWEGGTTYTADEFRAIVKMGFEPPPSVVQLGPTAVQGWKTGLVANSTTDWLLCPSCARRAAVYLPKIAGTGPSGEKLSETMLTETLLGRSQPKPTTIGIPEDIPPPEAGFPIETPTVILRSPEKICPTCNMEIPAEVTECDNCGSRFGVIIRGYCVTEHAVMECDSEGNCLACSQPVIDKWVESTLIEAGKLPEAEHPSEEFPTAVSEEVETPAAVPGTELASTKKCPMCAEIIKAEARICRFCGARFDVSIKGYCTHCHQLVEADASEKCSNCGDNLIDVRLISQLVDETIPPSTSPIQPVSPRYPLSISSPDLLSLPTEVERPGCVIAYAIFLWFGSAVIALTAIISFLYQPHEISGGSKVAAFLLGMAILSTAIGFGLWNLKNWARITLIVLLSLGILTNGITAFAAVFAPESFGDYGSEQFPAIICMFLFGLGISIWMIWWFVRNKRYFQRDT